MQATDVVRAATSSRSKKSSKNPQKQRTKLYETSTMQAPFDAAKVFSDDIPVIDLESDSE